MALPISVSREEAATSCAPAAAASVTVLTRATPAQTMTCPAALFPSRRISGTYRHAVTKATRAATRTSRRPRLAFGESFARTPGVVTVLGLIRGCISGIAVTSSRPIWLLATHRRHCRPLFPQRGCGCRYYTSDSRSLDRTTHLHTPHTDCWLTVSRCTSCSNSDRLLPTNRSERNSCGCTNQIRH